MSTSFSCPAFPSGLSTESQERLPAKAPEINAAALSPFATQSGWKATKQRALGIH